VNLFFLNDNTENTLFYCNLKLKGCLDQIQWQKRNPNLKIRFQVLSFNIIIFSTFRFTNNILIILDLDFVDLFQLINYLDVSVEI